MYNVNYFKHLNKGSRGLPDKDCKYEVNFSLGDDATHTESTSMVEHEHKNSTKYFEELIEALEDNYLEDLYEHDHMVSEQGKKIPKYPSKEWVVARSVTPEIGKNAESTISSKDRVTNIDVTSHDNIANTNKYVDTANTDEHNREVYTNIDYKQGKKTPKYPTKGS